MTPREEKVDMNMYTLKYESTDIPSPVRFVGTSDRITPDSLPNRKEIEAHEAWHWMNIWTPKNWIYNSQAQWEDSWGHLTIFPMNVMQLTDGGIAIWYSYSPEKVVRYFELRNCDHEWSYRQLGNCWKEYTCRKCGKKYDVDSSG